MHLMGLILTHEQVPYNLSDKTMVLYPVPRPGDMIERGLVRKTGLIKDFISWRQAV